MRNCARGKQFRRETTDVPTKRDFKKSLSMKAFSQFNYLFLWEGNSYYFTWTLHCCVITFK